MGCALAARVTRHGLPLHQREVATKGLGRVQLFCVRVCVPKQGVSRGQWPVAVIVGLAQTRLRMCRLPSTCVTLTQPLLWPRSRFLVEKRLEELSRGPPCSRTF